MRTTSLPHSSITFRDDEILHIEYFDNTHFTLKESKEIFEACRELCADIEKCPLLVSGGLQTTNDSEFRNHNASEDVLKYCSAVAVVVNSLAHVIMVNFFIKFHKPHAPTKFFNSQEKAIDWLKQYEVSFFKDAVKQNQY